MSVKTPQDAGQGPFAAVYARCGGAKTLVHFIGTGINLLQCRSGKGLHQIERYILLPLYRVVLFITRCLLARRAKAGCLQKGCKI